MLIDTHCHLDANEFDPDRDIEAQAALDAGVGAIVIPAVHRVNFQTVIDLSLRYTYCAYALGIHPMYVDKSDEADLTLLETLLEQQMQTGKPPVAVGEIGLDYFAERSGVEYDRARQEHFFVAQLKLAKQFDLPVILHVRRSVDEILKQLRRIKVKGGIAHAFNGSRQQADILIDLGFKLGFGGAMTYSRSLHIRELAATLPLEAIVLETDAPDIPPEWIKNRGRNSPKELAYIAKILSEIRGVNVRQVTEITTKNAREILPNLQ